MVREDRGDYGDGSGAASVKVSRKARRRSGARKKKCPNCILCVPCSSAYSARNLASFSFLKRWKSVLFAIDGLSSFLKNEHNARIHFAATILVIATSFYVKPSRVEIMLLIFSVGLVWVTEIINTAIERCMDHLSPARHQNVKIIKDLAAAAVLFASIMAIAIGAIIFIPKI